MTTTGTVTVRQPHERFHTDLGWLDSWHSFSFGRHHDPDEVGFGLLLVNNDDIVAPGAGFPAHFHRDMEIVTWVLSGALEHRDSTGTEGIIRPDLAQRMSAGTGITHSELNASSTEPVHFVQMWVLPGPRGIEPSYEQKDLSDALDAGGLVAVASGQGHDSAVAVHQPDAVLWAGRLGPNQRATVPDGDHVHLFVAMGSAELEGGGALERGAAARLVSAGELDMVAGSDGAEVLIWVTA